MNISAFDRVIKALEWAKVYIPTEAASKLLSQNDLCVKIFNNTAKLLAQSLASSENAPLSACFTLNRTLQEFKKASPCKAESCSLQVDLLMTLILLKASCDDTHCALSHALTAAVLPEERMTQDQYFNCLTSTLNAFSDCQLIPGEQTMLMPKQGLAFLQYKSIVFLTDTNHIGTEKIFELNRLFFGVTAKRWALKAMSVCSELDESSKAGAILLNYVVQKNPPDMYFRILTYPRNVLFIEKLVLQNIYSFTMIDVFIQDKVTPWLEKGVSVAYSEMEPVKGARPLYLETKEEGILELGLYLQTKKQCDRLAKGDTAGLDNFLRKLLAYKMQDDSDDDFFDLCRDMLVVNELLYKKSQLVADWKKLENASVYLCGLKTEHRLFKHRSYLPRKRLKFLCLAGMELYEHLNLHPTPRTAPEFNQLTYRSAKELWPLTKFFHFFVRDEDTLFYSRLDCKLSECVQKSPKNCKKDRVLSYVQVAFSTDSGGEDVWKVASLEEYMDIIGGAKKAL